MIPGRRTASVGTATPRSKGKRFSKEELHKMHRDHVEGSSQ